MLCGPLRISRLFHWIRILELSVGVEYWNGLSCYKLPCSEAGAYLFTTLLELLHSLLRHLSLSSMRSKVIFNKLQQRASTIIITLA